MCLLEEAEIRDAGISARRVRHAQHTRTQRLTNGIEQVGDGRVIRGLGCAGAGRTDRADRIQEGLDRLVLLHVRKLPGIIPAFNIVWAKTVESERAAPGGPPPDRSLECNQRLRNQPNARKFVNDPIATRSSRSSVA